MIVDLKSKLPFDEREERDSFSIVVRNTTTSTVYANVLGATTNLKDNANATISYSYNLSGETFATNSITIQYKTTNQPTFQTATLPLNQQNIEGVVFALNQLGIGTWFYSGNDVITYNNTYEFGTLDITAVVPPVTTAGQINSIFATNIGTGFDNQVESIVRQSDGKFIVCGNFTIFNGNVASYVLRLNADGTFDNTFFTGLFVGSIARDAAIQSDGKIIVVGNFNSYNGNPVSNILRLNTNGSYDATFNQGTGLSSDGYSVEIQTDGKIVVAGTFITYNGNAAVGIVRINTNGSYDATFNSTLGTGAGIGLDLAIQTDGKIILGGGFSFYNGNPANSIVRINTNGSYDGTFNTVVGVNNTVWAIEIQTDGKILAGGSFTQYDGNLSDNLVRINTNGSYDATFPVATGFDNNVLDIAVQPNGKIIAVGDFTDYQGNAVSRIVRINTDATYDNTFVQGSGFFSTAIGIFYDSINNLITVGGTFTSYDTTLQNNITQIYTVSPA